MTEHLSNGQFASKDVTNIDNASKKRRIRGKPFVKGDPRCGRPKGTPNKITRAAKEFLMELCDDQRVQKAVRRRILKGDAVAFFRALEHVLGKPKENEGEPQKHEVRFGWMK